MSLAKFVYFCIIGKISLLPPKMRKFFASLPGVIAVSAVLNYINESICEIADARFCALEVLNYMNEGIWASWVAINSSLSPHFKLHKRKYTQHLP